MNNIPLPKSNKKEDIDTTIIAIKNYLDDLRRQLGLDESETTDLSGYATKAELESAVNTLDAEIEGLNPVDVVEYGNTKPVTSNAVSVSQSYINSEVATGEKFYTNAGVESDVFSRQLYFYLDSYSDNNNRRMFMTELTISSSAKIILEATGYVLFDKPTTTTGYQRRTTLGSVILGQDLMPTFASAVYFEQSTHKVHVKIYLDKRTYTPTEIQGYVRVRYTK